MGKMAKLMMAGLVLATMGATAARAESYARTTVKNNSSNSVWVTYYNVTKNQMGTDCIHSGSSQTEDWSWSYVTESEGGIYFRFEYKQNTNCGGNTLYDSHYGGLYRMPALGQTLSVSIPAR